MSAIGALAIFSDSGNAAGGSIELAEAKAEWTPMPGAIHLYVRDADAVYERSLQSGATSLQAPTDMYYGERSAAVRDLVGNRWYIA